MSDSRTTDAVRICDSCAYTCRTIGIYAMSSEQDFTELCAHYERRRITQWEKLFGTPERAASSLSTMYRCELGLVKVHCGGCSLHGACSVYDGDENELLEWLESEVRDD